MVKWIIEAYDYLKAQRLMRLSSLLLLTVLFGVLLTRLEYKEDISDFLPLDSKYEKAMALYQDISGADRLYVLFQSKVPLSLYASTASVLSSVETTTKPPFSPLLKT